MDNFKPFRKMCDRTLRKSIPTLRKTRSDFTHTHDRTVPAIRSVFRDEVVKRLRSKRSKSVDRFRQIVESYDCVLNYESVAELRAAIKVDPEAQYLLRATEVSDVLNQIEQEMAQVNLEDQAEQHERETERETDDILRRHLFECKGCRGVNSEGNVCDKCTQR